MRKSVQDIYLAAAYLAYEVPLKQVNRDDPKRQKFIFEGTVKEVITLESGLVLRLTAPTLDDVEAKYIGKCLLFPPNYPDAIRRIKTSIHTVEDNE